MPKLTPILILASICLVIPCFAVVIFEDEIQSEERFKAEGLRIEPQWIEDMMLFHIENSDEKKIIDVRENDCRRSGNLKICIGEIKTYLNDIEVENPNSEETEYRTNATITAYIAEVNITRNVKESAQIGEKVDVTVTLANSGEPAGIEYKESLKYDPLDVFGCRLEDNDIVYTGNLAKGEVHECTYSFVPEKKGTVKLSAKLKYFDGINDVSESVSTEVDVQDYPVKIELKADKRSMVVGKRQNITVEIENTVVNLTASFNADQSDGIRIIRSNVTGLESGYLEIEGIKTGTQNMFAELKYRFDGVDQTQIDTVEIEIVADHDLELISELEQAYANESFSLKLQVRNNKESLNDVEAKLVSDILNSSNSMDELNLRNSIILVDREVIVPRPGTYELIINVTYKTVYGEKITELFKKDLVVNEATKSFKGGNVKEKSFIQSTEEITKQDSENVSFEDRTAANIFFEAKGFDPSVLFILVPLGLALFLIMIKIVKKHYHN